MRKLCKRFFGVSVALCMVLALFGVVAPTTVRAAESRQETQILSSSEAKKNCEGVQVGWGKINHPYLSVLTMKELPERYASIVMVKGSWLRSVNIMKSTDLKLYGLYEDDRGDVYRHVGVTYQNVVYYGYILEERIKITETFVNEVSPTPGPTATPVPAPVYELVSEGDYDRNVIPDKYNTGCYDTEVIEKINTSGVVDGVEYKLGDNGNRLVIDLYYSKVNAALSDEVIIRNKDFSDKVFSVYHASMIDTGKKLIFENCVFGQVFLDYKQDMAEFYFNNCSIQYLSGSNATFERCFFGGSYYDGMNPLQNVAVKNSYFAGYPQSNELGKHSDSVQIFGRTDIEAKNILFQNCRMEMPVIKDKKGQTGYINACFMVALEYSAGQNFLFENCIINGGGYSIYALDSDGKCALTNIVFRNISLGNGHLYGDIYPKVAEGVIFENLHDTKNLYVASVWKDSEGKIHLSVSNDTAEDKTLLLVTENGKQEIAIPSKVTSEAAGAAEYYDLAIDMEIVSNDTVSDWVVCYDGEETEENQIRYVNWSGETVYRTVYY